MRLLTPRVKFLASRLPGMIDCREAHEFIDAYLAGSLSFAERASFRVHLAMCAECRAYLADYQAAPEAIKAAVEASEPATSEMPEDLVKAILASRRPPQDRR